MSLTLLITAAPAGAFTLSCSCGVFDVTGEPVALRAARQLAAASGVYTLTGEAVLLTASGAIVFVGQVTGQAQGPLPPPVPALLEVAQGETLTLALALDILAPATLDLASALDFTARAYPGGPALLSLGIGGGVTLDIPNAAATARLDAPQTADLPLGRLHWDCTLALTTGEVYRVARGILQVYP